MSATVSPGPTTTSATVPPAVPAGRRRLTRAATVLGGVVAPVVVLEALGLAGLTVHAPQGDHVAAVPAALVAAAAALAGLAGWALLAVLDRLVARPARVWRTVALVVLLLSFAGPWTAAGVTTGDRVGLSLLHLAVAAVLLAGLPRTARPRTR